MTSGGPLSARVRLIAGHQAILAASVALAGNLGASVGADTPWTTYEAEAMRTTGTVLGPEV